MQASKHAFNPGPHCSPLFPRQPVMNSIPLALSVKESHGLMRARDPERIGTKTQQISYFCHPSSLRHSVTAIGHRWIHKEEKNCLEDCAAQPPPGLRTLCPLLTPASCWAFSSTEQCPRHRAAGWVCGDPLTREEDVPWLVACVSHAGNLNPWSSSAPLYTRTA